MGVDEKMTAAADAMHAELLRQVEGLMDATDGQRAADLDRISTLVAGYEELRWPILPPWEDIEEDTTLSAWLEKWLTKQPAAKALISDAAAHFKVSRERIEQVAGDHPWMGSNGTIVFLDGE